MLGKMLREKFSHSFNNGMSSNGGVNFLEIDYLRTARTGGFDVRVCDCWPKGLLQEIEITIDKKGSVMDIAHKFAGKSAARKLS